MQPAYYIAFAVMRIAQIKEYMRLNRLQTIYSSKNIF